MILTRDYLRMTHTSFHIKIIQNWQWLMFFIWKHLLLQMLPICLISGVFFPVDPSWCKDLYLFFLFTVIYSRPCQLVQTTRQRFNCGHARTEASDACSTFEPKMLAKMSRNETLVIQDRFRAFRFSLTLSSVECASIVYCWLWQCKSVIHIRKFRSFLQLNVNCGFKKIKKCSLVLL